MHRALLILGMLTLAGAWLGPLPFLARGAFWAHMTMHMLVVAVAAPLLALGLAQTRFDPVQRRPQFFAPVPLSIAELVIVWVWHTPALHHLARHTAHGVALEQGTFLLAGLLVWLSVFGGTRDGNRLGAGVIALLLTSMHMTLLGALLALTPRPLFMHAGVFTRLSPLEDQQLGGAIMIVVGGIAYLAGGLWLMTALLRGKRPAASGEAAPPGRPLARTHGTSGAT
jgi:putative membrane protein